jgi:class 3 adenylate cyclase
MTTRRLAAILAADVSGFSAMMACDEEGRRHASEPSGLR